MNFYNENNYYYNLVEPLLVIPLSDFILINFFGKKGRWFQLHSLINFIITFQIKNDVLLFLINPLQGISLINNIKPLIYISYLHSYHFFIKKVYFIELFHHILFVFLGALPCIFLWNNNLISLWIFSGCGLPGAIDYFFLTLFKNDIINVNKQKQITAFINNYFRMPMNIYGLTVSYIARKENIIQCNDYFFTYILILIYLNGTIFNQMSIESKIKVKYTNKFDYNV